MICYLFLRESDGHASLSLSGNSFRPSCSASHLYLFASLLFFLSIFKVITDRSGSEGHPLVSEQYAWQTVRFKVFWKPMPILQNAWKTLWHYKAHLEAFWTRVLYWKCSKHNQYRTTIGQLLDKCAVLGLMDVLLGFFLLFHISHKGFKIYDDIF